MKLSPSHEFSSALQPFLKENSFEEELSALDELDEELAFWEPLCSLEAQNRRTVLLENEKDDELEDDDESLLDPLPLD